MFHAASTVPCTIDSQACTVFEVAVPTTSAVVPTVHFATAFDESRNPDSSFAFWTVFDTPSLRSSPDHLTH